MDAIVCDTSSLIRLFKCDSLPLIAVGFDHVYIPQAVWDECSTELQSELQVQQFIQIETSADTIQKYGRGERAMLNIAINRKIPNVLTDDDKALREAVRQSLTAFTALDISVLAKGLGASVSIRSAVEKMINHNELISSEALEQALVDAGEQ